MRKLTDFYDLLDIYNMNETALFYLADAAQQGLRSQGDKDSADAGHGNQRADGSDKLPLVFIGKSENLRTFKGHDVSAELGVGYTNSKKVWMNSTIFIRWQHALNLRMRRGNRRVLLLVDNYSSYVRPLAQLTNVRLGLSRRTLPASYSPSTKG
ncbi:putative jerky [Phytophthora cinnamomi]|uniref:putative jerky n=1 Tax=Phytophthora cinnamomi TaxID=4785 RepID=UPI0035595FED|nr:putative jerky [Phytophthora cinnamomi]